MKSVNGSLSETLYGSVMINEDLHLDGNHSHDDNLTSELDDQGSEDDSMVQNAAILIAILSAIVLVGLLLQPEPKKTLVEEE